MRRRFFVEQFVADRAFMEGEAAHHLGRVLREQRKLMEQLGYTIRVDNKPADRNSSLFDKVKDIFG
jgi:hypothetical protein